MLVFAMLGVLAATLASVLKGIPDMARGMLWGGAVAALLIAPLSMLLFVRWRRTRKEWLTGIYTDGPKIVFGEKGFHTKQVGFGNYPKLDKVYLETEVISLRFKNASDTMAAKDLRIRFKCVGRGAQIRWINARLDSFTQPSEQVTFNLEPGAEEVASFIIKEPQSSDCYLFNNDSPGYPRAQNPMWKLDKGTYKLLVEFIGRSVVRRFECTFINRGKGANSLKIKSYRVLDLLD